jgi:hypothetical protein
VKTSLAVVLVSLTVGAVEAGAQQSTVQGHVTSPSGESIEGATITAAFVRFHNGRHMVTSSITTTADDAGAYRFSELAVGRYLVNAIRPGVRTVQPTGIDNLSFPQQAVRLFAEEPTGHKTRSVFERYNIVSDGDLRTAARQLHGLTGAKQGQSRGVFAQAAGETSQISE